MNDRILNLLRSIVSSNKPPDTKATADVLLATWNKRRILECVKLILDDDIFSIDWSSHHVSELARFCDDFQWTIMQDKDWKELTERTNIKHGELQ